MQSATTIRAEHTSPSDGEIRAKTLARVNFGLFRELVNLGTSRERICATLCLKNSEYEYLANLS